VCDDSFVGNDELLRDILGQICVHEMWTKFFNFIFPSFKSMPKENEKYAQGAADERREDM